MTILSFLIVLIILNIIYTLGFLIAQVLTKRYQHYFLGFDPGIRTFVFRNTKITLGIYVPIIGLSRIYCVDEAGKKRLFYPWQLRGVSIMKRLLLTYGGVLSLFVFGIIMAIASVYTSREQYISKDEVNRYGIYPSEAARAAGFLPGDKITAINGETYNEYYDLIRPDVVLSRETHYTIVRNNRELQIKIAEPAKNTQIEEPFLSLNAPFFVGDVVPGSPAHAVGIYKGDNILKVNGQAITSLPDLNTHLQADEDGELQLEIQRGGDSIGQKFEKIVQLTAEKKLGIFAEQEIQYSIKDHSLAQSVSHGTGRFLSYVATPNSE